MRPLLLLLLLTATAVVGLAQKPASETKAADDLLGNWEYIVRPESPVARGTFLLEQGERQLNGTIQTNASRKMENIQMTVESLSFTFLQPGMGTIRVELRVEGDSLVGEAQPDDADAMPFVATRHNPGSPPEEQ